MRTTGSGFWSFLLRLPAIDLSGHHGRAAGNNVGGRSFRIQFVADLAKVAVDLFVPPAGVPEFLRRPIELADNFVLAGHW